MRRIFLIFFVLMVLSVILSIACNLTPEVMLKAINSNEVRFAVMLSLKSALIATAMALVVGVPSAYTLARSEFLLKELIDSLVDLPVVLPPLISGLGLLLFFGDTPIGKIISKFIQVVFTPTGIVVAQFFIATPFVIRTVRAVFESIDPKYELIAMSLGSSKTEAFFKVVLPMARKGILAGAILAWARCMGEFGATLMLAGATRMRTETLPIAVYLNISVGNIDLALSIAFVMLAIAVLTIASIKFVVSGGVGNRWS